MEEQISLTKQLLSLPRKSHTFTKKQFQFLEKFGIPFLLHLWEAASLSLSSSPAGLDAQGSFVHEMIDLAFDTSAWNKGEEDLFRVSSLLKSYVPTVVGDLCGLCQFPLLFSRSEPPVGEGKKKNEGASDKRTPSFTKSILPKIESLLTFLTQFVEKREKGEATKKSEKGGGRDPAEQLISLVSYFGGKVASLLIRGEQTEKANETQKLLQSRLFREGISSSLYMSLQETAPPASPLKASSEDFGGLDEEEVYDPSNDPEQCRFLESLVEREEGGDGDMVLSALERYGGELQMTAKYDDEAVVKFSRLFFACVVKHSNRVGDCLSYAMDVRDVWGKKQGKEKKDKEALSDSGIDESDAFRPPVWMLGLLKHSQEIKAFMGSIRQDLLRKIREQKVESKGKEKEEEGTVGEDQEEDEGEELSYAEILKPYFVKVNFLLKLSPLTRMPSSSIGLSSASQRPPPSVIQQWVNTKNDSSDLSSHSSILLVIAEIEHFLKHTHFDLLKVSEEITIRSKFCSQRTKSLQFIRQLLLLTANHPAAQQHLLRFVACSFRSSKVEPVHFLENTAGVPHVYVEMCRSAFEGLFSEVLGVLEKEVSVDTSLLQLAAMDAWAIKLKKGDIPFIQCVDIFQRLHQIMTKNKATGTLRASGCAYDTVLSDDEDCDDSWVEEERKIEESRRRLSIGILKLFRFLITQLLSVVPARSTGAPKFPELFDSTISVLLQTLHESVTEFVCGSAPVPHTSTSDCQQVVSIPVRLSPSSSFISIQVARELLFPREPLVEEKMDCSALGDEEEKGGEQAEMLTGDHKMKEADEEKNIKEEETKEGDSGQIPVVLRVLSSFTEVKGIGLNSSFYCNSCNDSKKRYFKQEIAYVSLECDYFQCDQCFGSVPYKHRSFYLIHHPEVPKLSKIKRPGPFDTPLSRSLNAWALTFWIYPVQNNGAQQCVMYHGTLQPTPHLYPAVFIGGGRRLKVQVTTTDRKLPHTSTVISLNSPQSVPLQKWTHISVVYQNDELTLFLNGVTDSSITLRNPVLGPSQKFPFIIGSDAHSQPFDGTVSDMRFFTRGISPKMIKTLLSTGPFSMTGDERAYQCLLALKSVWELNEPESDSNDSVGLGSLKPSIGTISAESSFSLIFELITSTSSSLRVQRLAIQTLRILLPLTPPSDLPLPLHVGVLVDSPSALVHSILNTIGDLLSGNAPDFFSDENVSERPHLLVPVVRSYDANCLTGELIMLLRALISSKLWSELVFEVILQSLNRDLPLLESLLLQSEPKPEKPAFFGEALTASSLQSGVKDAKILFAARAKRRQEERERKEKEQKAEEIKDEPKVEEEPSPSLTETDPESPQDPDSPPLSSFLMLAARASTPPPPPSSSPYSSPSSSPLTSPNFTVFDDSSSFALPDQLLPPPAPLSLGSEKGGAKPKKKSRKKKSEGESDGGQQQGSSKEKTKAQFKQWVIKESKAFVLFRGIQQSWDLEDSLAPPSILPRPSPSLTDGLKGYLAATSVCGGHLELVRIGGHVLVEPSKEEAVVVSHKPSWNSAEVRRSGKAKSEMVSISKLIPISSPPFSPPKGSVSQILPLSPSAFLDPLPAVTPDSVTREQIELMRGRAVHLASLVSHLSRPEGTDYLSSNILVFKRLVSLAITPFALVHSPSREPLTSRGLMERANLLRMHLQDSEKRVKRLGFSGVELQEKEPNRGDLVRYLSKRSGVTEPICRHALRLNEWDVSYSLLWLDENATTAAEKLKKEKDDIIEKGTVGRLSCPFEVLPMTSTERALIIEGCTHLPREWCVEASQATTIEEALSRAREISVKKVRESYSPSSSTPTSSSPIQASISGSPSSPLSSRLSSLGLSETKKMLLETEMGLCIMFARDAILQLLASNTLPKGAKKKRVWKKQGNALLEQMKTVLNCSEVVDLMKLLSGHKTQNLGKEGSEFSSLEVMGPLFEALVSDKASGGEELLSLIVKEIEVTFKSLSSSSSSSSTTPPPCLFGIPSPTRRPPPAESSPFGKPPFLSDYQSLTLPNLQLSTWFLDTLLSLYSSSLLSPPFSSSSSSSVSFPCGAFSEVMGALVSCLSCPKPNLKSKASDYLTKLIFLYSETPSQPSIPSLHEIDIASLEQEAEKEIRAGVRQRGLFPESSRAFLEFVAVVRCAWEKFPPPAKQEVEAQDGEQKANEAAEEGKTGEGKSVGDKNPEKIPEMTPERSQEKVEEIDEKKSGDGKGKDGEAKRELGDEEIEQIASKYFFKSYYLEARKKGSSTICVASVTDQKGPYVRIHAEGCDSQTDFWCKIDNPHIGPIGTAQKRGLKLESPPNFVGEFEWGLFLASGSFESVAAEGFLLGKECLREPNQKGDKTMDLRCFRFVAKKLDKKQGEDSDGANPLPFGEEVPGEIAPGLSLSTRRPGFVKERCANSCEIDEATMTMTHKGRSWGMVLVDKLLVRGVHYFEAELVKGEWGSTFYGVVQPEEFVPQSKGGYGLVNYRSITRKGGAENMYGLHFLNGDRVGMLIDVDEGKMWFFKNGSNLGLALDNLPSPLCPVLGSKGEGDIIKLLPVHFCVSVHSPPRQMRDIGCLFSLLEGIRTSSFSQPIVERFYSCYQRWIRQTQKIHRTKAGVDLVFDVSSDQLSKHGNFEYGDYVSIPGKFKATEAVVVGVHGQQLWFHDQAKGLFFVEPSVLRKVKLIERGGMRTTSSSAEEEEDEDEEVKEKLAMMKELFPIPTSMLLKELAICEGSLERCINELILRDLSDFIGKEDEEPEKKEGDEDQGSSGPLTDPKCFFFITPVDQSLVDLSLEEFSSLLHGGGWSFSSLETMVRAINQITYTSPFNVGPSQLLEELQCKPSSSLPSPAVICVCASLLHCFNECLQSALPVISLRDSVYQNSLGNRLTKSRTIIFRGVKKDFWSQCLARTVKEHQQGDDEYVDPSTIPFITVERQRALKEYNAAEDRFNNSLFYQMYEKLHTNRPSNFRQEFIAVLDGGQKRSFRLKFRGEGVSDNGGPYREVFAQMAEEVNRGTLPLFSPCKNHLEKAGENRETWVFDPSRDSSLDRSMLKFFGQMVGVACRCEIQMDLLLPPMFWKRMASLAIVPEDLNFVDHRSFTSLMGMKTIEEESFEEYFGDCVWDTQWSGSVLSHRALFPGGENVPLAFEDLEEYINENIQFRLNESESQENLVIAGLRDVLPLDSLKLMKWDEVRILFIIVFLCFCVFVFLCFCIFVFLYFCIFVFLHLYWG